MGKRQLDIRIIIIIVFFVGLCPILYVYEERFSLFIRSILESKLLHIIVWTIIFLIYMIHYFKFRRNNQENNTVISTTLPPFMDNFLGAVTYGTIITSTLTLIKGLYIQIFFNEPHFKDFSDFDIFSLLLALFFLLWYSTTKITEDVQDIFWIDQIKEIQTIPKNRE